MNRYLNFLTNIVGKQRQYSQLIQQLHRIEFYSLVPNDDNRAADGEELRVKFIDEAGGPQGSSSLPGGPCTMLEMLIGLAYRLEFELLGGRYERTAGEWFWVLIDNLGLTHCDDDLYSDGQHINRMVEIAIRAVLERGYEPDGNRGLFPLKRPEKDQRRVEIWYQMSSWVIENYPI